MSGIILGELCSEGLMQEEEVTVAPQHVPPGGMGRRRRGEAREEMKRDKFF